MPKIITISAIVVAAIAIGYFLVIKIAIANGFKSDSLSNTVKFDKDVWQKGGLRQRGQMFQYLVDSIGLLGKTRSEIKTLIGVPDDTNTITGSEYTSSISYRVDLGHAFIYDMMVYFDSTDRAKYVKIDD